MASKRAPREFSPPDRSDKDHRDGGGLPTNATEAGLTDPAAGDDLLKLAAAAEAKSQDFIGQLQRSAWTRSIRAFHNQHDDDSKYKSKFFKNRSKLFRPKTRSAVRKNLAAAAQALFSTSDVVSIKAEYDSNPVKVVSAGVINEVLNYRLDRAANNGIPWFITAMGAALDGNLHGVMCSKQFWDYEQFEKVRKYMVKDILVDAETEEPVLDPTTNEPAIVGQRIEEETEVKVVRDRPMILLMPPEHAIIDPGAPWHEPVQGSGYFGGRFPMTLDDLRSMIRNKSNAKSGAEWLDVDDEVLETACEDYDTKGVRIARDDGVDRYSSDTRGGSLSGASIVWVYEWFFRIDGVDYNFWTVGTRAFISQIKPTEEVYPEQFGQRPYVFGYSAIESHRIYPMAPVESWSPLQQEANDIVNLRLDVIKQSIAPIAKVKQGTMFDWGQLQNIGAPNSTVIVRNTDDLEFVKPPGAGGEAYQEMNMINADMDDLAGSFSTSSVQTSRQLNETVGGMRLMSGGANAMTEFDLRVFVETWVEPVLRQTVRGIQKYETDENILSLCGERAAKLFERQGVNEITDKDLMTEVSVRVNVGVGTADPEQRLRKLAMGGEMIGKALPYFDKRVKLKAEEFIKEVMGAIGYNDGMRFYEISEQPEQQKPPEQVQAELEMQLEQARMQMEERLAMGGYQNDQQIEQMKGRIAMITTLIKEFGQENRDRMATEASHASGQSDRLFNFFQEGQRGKLQERIADKRNAASAKAKASQRPAA